MQQGILFSVRDNEAHFSIMYYLEDEQNIKMMRTWNDDSCMRHSKKGSADDYISPYLKQDYVREIAWMKQWFMDAILNDCYT